MSLRPLMDVIKKAEAPQGYNQLNSHMERAVGRHTLTEMTTKEVLDLQKLALDRGTESTAVGQYQIIRPTLLWLATQLDLKAEDKFDADYQDGLATYLMNRRGLKDFLDDKVSSVDFANRLAMEWAGLPVVSHIVGSRGVMLSPGMSYYAGDGLNKATVSPTEVLTALSQIKESEAIPPPPTEWRDDVFGKLIWPILSGQLRHLLTAIGGFLIAAGWVDESAVEAMIGGIMALVGLILSGVSKVNVEKKADAERLTTTRR